MERIYLSSFHFPSSETECDFLSNIKMTCFNNFYPFGVLPTAFRNLEFSSFTILYGGNGCGKTTMLNLIADKLGILRNIKINKSSFMGAYTALCQYEMGENPPARRIITSDDVFSNIFLIRDKNEIIDRNREETFDYRSKCCVPNTQLKDIMDEFVGEEKWIDHLDTLLKIASARRKSASQFVRENVPKNIIGKSNGETALNYFYTNIQEPGLYLLDEPENSLSAVYQQELARHLADSVRFFDAQFIIATHSPFMLSIPGATIYNLDSEEFCTTNDWTSLENMAEYYRLFQRYANQFELKE